MRRGFERALAALLLGLAFGVTAEEIEVPKDVPMRARDLNEIPVELVEVSDTVAFASGVGNTYMVKTSAGNVVYDTGVGWQAEQQRDLLRAWSPGPVTHILVSHAHGDHNGGLAAWQQDIDAGAEVVAHERYPYMNRIFADTNEYLWKIRTGTLYPVQGDAVVEAFRAIPPTRLVDVHEDYAFEVGGVAFVAIAAEGSAEGEDALLLWMPETGDLFTGDYYGCLYPMVPNLYTVRGEKIRDPLDYVASLDRLIELAPSKLLPAHFVPIEGQDYIVKTLQVTRDGVQYVYDETVKGMNGGKSVWELMETIELPPELTITQGHGKVSWNVRAIWELLAGWFYYEDVADLYHVPARAVYPDLVALAGGTEPIVARARARYAAGERLEAMRLLDVAKAAGPESAEALALRLAIFEALLEVSEKGLDNMSETGILRASVNQTREALVASGAEP